MTEPGAVARQLAGVNGRLDPGFPWGDNHPTRPQRLVVAVAIATFAAWVIRHQYAGYAGYHSDFSIVWFGARSLLRHVDPYPLVGPGLPYKWPWHLLYPATAFVAALPFAALSEVTASITFVWLSTFLLAYGMTRQSWHLLPLFASYAFISSAWLAQWSIIFTAAVFTPWLAFLTVAKPQAAIPVVGAAPCIATMKYAALGGIVLIVVSLLFLPGWPLEWLPLVRAADNLYPPITRQGGVVVLLVLLRWRRPDAWLVLLVSLMPSTWGWYNTLVILTIPSTYREACILSLVSSLGEIGGGFIMPSLSTTDEFYRYVGALMIATVYLPAVVVILRKANEGEMPTWLSGSASRFGRFQIKGG